MVQRVEVGVAVCVWGGCLGVYVGGCAKWSSVSGQSYLSFGGGVGGGSCPVRSHRFTRSLPDMSVVVFSPRRTDVTSTSVRLYSVSRKHRLFH